MPEILKDKQYILIFTISIILLVLLSLASDLMLPGHPFYYSKMQHQDYIALAKDPFNSGNAPFCWRLFIPVIAHIIPVPHQYTFFSITMLSLLFTGLLLFLIIKHYKFSEEYAFYGILLFYGMVWAVRFNIIEFWYPDSLLFFLITLAVYASLKKKKILFLSALLTGITVKETMLITIPLWYSINHNSSFKNIDRVTIRDTIILSLPAVILFLLIRAFIPSSNNYNMLSDFYYFTSYRLEAAAGLVSSLNYDVVENQPQWLTASINIYRITFGVFGGLLFLVLLNIRALKKVFKQYWLFILLVIFQLFIAYDSERLLVTAFIPMIIFILFILQYAERELGISKMWIRSYVIIYFGLQLIAFQSYYHQTYYAAFYQTVLSLLFAVFIYYRKMGVVKSETGEVN